MIDALVALGSAIDTGRSGAAEVTRAEESMRRGAEPPKSDKRAGSEGGWVRRLSRYVLVHKGNLLIAFAGAIVGSLAQVVVPSSSARSSTT